MLDDEHPAGAQEAQGRRRQVAHDVEAVGSPVERERRVVQRTSGSRGTIPTGMYGGFEATTDTVPSSSGRASARSPSTRRAFSAPTAAMLRRVQTARLGRELDRDDGRVRHLGGHGQRDGAAARAEVDRDRGGLGRGAQGVDGELRDPLGLGPGHEDARSDVQLDRPEAGGARDVLERLPGGAPGDRGGGTPRRLGRRGRPR